MSTFPSTLTTYTNPQATDKLNSPSHSGIETAQNSGLSQVEAVIGLAGSSSIVGTIQYDLRSPASSGGGHVQSANKGGTGQTSFTKGDLLIASSTSILSKLSIGADGTSPIADSSQSTGVSWGTVSATLPYAQDSGTGSVYAISPVPCVLSYTAGQIYVAKITNANTVTSPALSISSLVAKKIVNLDGSSVLSGHIPSSSLGLFGYDGSASVMQLLNPVPPWTYISSAGFNGSSPQNVLAPSTANFAIATVDGSGSNVAAHGSMTISRVGATSGTQGSKGTSADNDSTVSASWVSSTISLTGNNMTTVSGTIYFYT